MCTPAQSGIGIRYPPRPPTPSIFAAALPIINNTSSAAEHLQLWGGGGGHEEKHRPDQKYFAESPGLKPFFGAEFDLGWRRNIWPNLYCRAKDFYFAIFRVLFCLIYIF